jgi:hypothetical protein
MVQAPHEADVRILAVLGQPALRTCPPLRVLQSVQDSRIVEDHSDDGSGDRRSHMDFIRIDRKLIFKALALSFPMEIVAALGLFAIPFDLGPAPGTSWWVVWFAVFGMLIHAPAMLARAYLGLEFWFVVGYLDSFVVIVVLMLLGRSLSRLISSL